MDDLMKDRSPDRGRDRERERSRRGDRPSRFSSSTRDRSPIREATRGRKGDCRVYVSNVAYESKWQDIKDLFRTEVGEVTYVELFVDEHDKPRGCGIVEFKTPELAARAVEKMHRFDLKGRKLVVKEDSDVIRDKFGRPITRGSNRGGDGDGGGSSSTNHRRDEGLNQRSTWDGNNQLPPINPNVPLTPPGMGGGGGGGGSGNSGNSSKYGNTYGLSTSFLESLWINGPLVSKVFVANLDYKVDEKKLREVFKLAGKVIDCEISMDKDGKSRGFGVVEYDHPVEAVQAISLLHNQTLFDRRLTVRMDRVDKQEGPPKLPEGLKSIGLGLGNNGTILHDVPRNLQHCNNNPQPQVGPPTNVQLQAAMAAATAAAQAQLAQGQLAVNQVSLSGPNPNLSNVSGLLGVNVPELANLNTNQPFGPGSSNQNQSVGGLGPSLSGLNVNIPSGLGIGQSGIGGIGMSGFNNMSNQNNISQSSSGFGNNNFETLSAALSGNNVGGYSSSVNFNDRESFRRDSQVSFNGSPRGNPLGNGRGNMGSNIGGNIGGNIQPNTNYKRSDTVVIKNLPSNTEWRHLIEKFREVGDIQDVQMGKDTALIRFKNDWEADRAIRQGMECNVHVEDHQPHDHLTVTVLADNTNFCFNREVKSEPLEH